MTTIADAPTAQRCQGTPILTVIDNRGLVARTVQYNRGAVEEPVDELISQQTFSPRGHLTSSVDPRLWSRQQVEPTTPPNFRYLSSLSGRELQVRSQDAGEWVALYDVEGGVIWQQDSRHQQLLRTFDTLHRLTSISEVSEGVSRVSERLIYANAVASNDANQRGQLLQSYSPAGLTLTPSYSITGQRLTSQQQFLRDDVLHSDWVGTMSDWWAALTLDTYLTRWAYDALGQQLQLTDAKNNQQRQRFNIAGQLAESELLLSGQSSPQAVLRRIDYSAASQVLHEEAGNGVVSDYVYEPQTQRPSTLTTTRPNHNGRPTLLQSLAYQYDPIGNLLAITDASKAARYTHNQRVEPGNHYTYDALYQLCQASGRENANAGQQTQALPAAIVPLWQEAGQLTKYTRSYTYDRGRNLTAIQHVGLHGYTLNMVVAGSSNRAVQQTGGLTPQDVDDFFDACGNLQQLTAGQPLAWDCRNQLLRTSQVTRGAANDDTEVYWYDSQGQRATKLGTVLTSGTTRTQRVRYLPGLELRITEQRQSQGGSTQVTEALNVTQFAATGRQALRVLHWEQGKPADIENNQPRYSLDDQLGSSLLEVDQQADIVTWEEYYPFGGTAVWSARNETETRYKFVRYSGKERDATGLYYYGFRYYAPWLGRWLNPDPAGTVDGLNLFGMVGNNPIIQKDVGGLGVFSNLFGSQSTNSEPRPTSNEFKLALKRRIQNARITDTPLNEANYLSGHVQSIPTPASPENGGLFYHEIQRADSGTCSVHAANAYRGAGTYRPDDFTQAYFDLLEMPRETATANMLMEGNDSFIVSYSLSVLEPYKNLWKTGTTTELATTLDCVDLDIDRAMVSLSGQDESGHWLAFRKGGNGKWYKIDSYPGGINLDDPQPNISPADFLRGLRGRGDLYSIIYPSGAA